MLKIKLFAIAAFLAFAACAFLFPNSKIEAQTSVINENRDNFLEKVMDYKQWKRIQKPEKKSDEAALILNSTGMG